MTCPRCNNYIPGHATGGHDICTCPKTEVPRPAAMEQLLQLKQPVCDGNLISKAARDELVRDGMAGRIDGWNFLTADGVRVLRVLGFLKS